LLEAIFLLVSLTYTFLYTLSWVKFQKYQFLERSYDIVAQHHEYSQKWHWFKGLNQFVFFYLLSVKFGYLIGFVDIIFYWILFDGWLNKSVLKRNFFYVGTTGKIDKAIQWVNNGIKTVYKQSSPAFISAVIKISLLIYSIFLLFTRGF